MVRNVTLHFWFGDFPSVRSIDLEVIGRQDSRLSEPQVIYCDGILPACSLNNFGIKSVCDACIARTRYHHSLLRLQTKLVPMSTLLSGHRDAEIDVPVTPAFLSDLDQPIPNIGMGALSSTISTTRDRLLCSDRASLLAQKYLRTALKIRSVTATAIDKFSPQSIVVHNGRLAEYHAVFITGRHCGVDVYTHEVCTPNSGWFLFKNGRVHDRDHYSQLIKYSTSDVDASEMAQVTLDFMSKKRSGTVLYENFTKQQMVGKRTYSPAGQKVVAIFTSSEDEFAAIGPEWDFPLFKSQLEGISWITSHLTLSDQPVLFVVRMHPNMMNVHQSDLIPYMNFAHRNVVVIWPDSPVDSYAVMDDADVVITFGSTIGVEATYWNKPVIELGHSLFEHLDVTYQPSSKEELLALIVNPPEPKPKCNVDSYVYTICNGGYKYKHVMFGLNSFVYDNKPLLFPTHGLSDRLTGLFRSGLWALFIYQLRDVIQRCKTILTGDLRC